MASSPSPPPPTPARRYKELLRNLDFVDIDLSERDASLCFAYARMVVVEGASERGYVRDTCLPVCYRRSNSGR